MRKIRIRRHAPTNYSSLKKFQAARINLLSLPRSETAVREDKTLFSGCFLNTEDRGRIVAPRCVTAFEAGIFNTIGSSSRTNKYIIQIHRACGVAICGVKAQENKRFGSHIENRRCDFSPRRARRHFDCCQFLGPTRITPDLQLQ